MDNMILKVEVEVAVVVVVQVEEGERINKIKLYFVLLALSHAPRMRNISPFSLVVSPHKNGVTIWTSK